MLNAHCVKEAAVIGRTLTEDSSRRERANQRLHNTVHCDGVAFTRKRMKLTLSFVPFWPSAMSRSSYSEAHSTSAPGTWHLAVSCAREASYFFPLSFFLCFCSLGTLKNRTTLTDACALLVIRAQQALVAASETSTPFPLNFFKRKKHWSALLLHCNDDSICVLNDHTQRTALDFWFDTYTGTRAPTYTLMHTYTLTHNTVVDICDDECHKRDWHPSTNLQLTITSYFC